MKKMFIPFVHRILLHLLHRAILLSPPKAISPCLNSKFQKTKSNETPESNYQNPKLDCPIATIGFAELRFAPFERSIIFLRTSNIAPSAPSCNSTESAEGNLTVFKFQIPKNKIQTNFKYQASKLFCHLVF